MKAFFLPLVFVSAITISNVQAQGTATKETTASNSLQNQFNNLKNNSNSYSENKQEYKVIKLSTLNSFWDNVQNNIKESQKEIVQARQQAEADLEKAQAHIAEQNQQLEALKQENALKEQEVQKSESAINNLSVFGLDMPKQLYVIITTAIIALLLIAFAVIFSLYKKSMIVTVRKQKDFDEIDLEYNEYKKTARERELKIKRDMQTEMNRVEELKQEIAALQKQVQI